MPNISPAEHARKKPARLQQAQETGLIPLLPPNYQGPPDEQALGAVMARYGLEMDMESIPVLAERHGLVSGEAPA